MLLGWWLQHFEGFISMVMCTSLNPQKKSLEPKWRALAFIGQLKKRICKIVVVASMECRNERINKMQCIGKVNVAVKFGLMLLSK